MKTLIAFLWLCCLLSTASAEPLRFPTACVGAKKAHTHIVFLQGIAPAPPDVNYEALLDRVGKDLNIRFAVPRSTVHCRNSAEKFCWGTEDPDSVAAVYATVRRSAERCFSLQQHWGLLGFSNGGYHAGRVVAQGHQPLPSWTMAVGSAGVAPTVAPLVGKRRAPFYLEVGTEDLVRDDSRRFYQALRQQGFNVRYREYQGEHQLTETILYTLLEDVLWR